MFIWPRFRAGKFMLCTPLHVTAVSDHMIQNAYNFTRFAKLFTRTPRRLIETCRQLVKFMPVLLEIFLINSVIAAKLASSQQPVVDKPDDRIADFSDEEKDMCVIFTLIIITIIG